MSLIILKEIPVFVNLGYNLVFFSIMTIGHDNILLTTYIVEMWNMQTAARTMSVGARSTSLLARLGPLNCISDVFSNSNKSGVVPIDSCFPQLKK